VEIVKEIGHDDDIIDWSSNDFGTWTIVIFFISNLKPNPFFEVQTVAYIIVTVGFLCVILYAVFTVRVLV